LSNQQKDSSSNFKPKRAALSSINSKVNDEAGDDISHCLIYFPIDKTFSVVPRNMVMQKGLLLEDDIYPVKFNKKMYDGKILALGSSEECKLQLESAPSRIKEPPAFVSASANKTTSLTNKQDLSQMGKKEMSSQLVDNKATIARNNEQINVYKAKLSEIQFLLIKKETEINKLNRELAAEKQKNSELVDTFSKEYSLSFIKIKFYLDNMIFIYFK